MDMEQAIKELDRRKNVARQMGGEAKVKAQHARGRLTVRERIDKLVDPGSFWETGLLSTSEYPEKEAETAADGRVCGIARINGRKVAIAGEDRTVIGGSGGNIGHSKVEHVISIANRKGYPVIELGDDAGGVRLPDRMGAKGMTRARHIGEHISRHVSDLPRRTPRIAAVLGECFGEPSWKAGRADFVVMVKGTAMGAAGPRIIEQAIGQKITPQQLAGWEIHATYTGQVEAFAESEEDAFNIIKKFLSYMPSHCGEEPPFLATNDPVDRRLENIDKIVTTRLNQGYDMHRVIKQIVDDGAYFPLKGEWARAMVTCLARIGGRVVGIIANNPMFNAGAPDVPAIEKSAEMICLCDTYNIPIIFLADIPGMFPGADAEKMKLPTKIITLLEAMDLCTVPKIGVLLRKAYGIGWQCMCVGHEDMYAAWPIASISFVDPEIGVKLVYGRKLAEAKDPAAETARLKEQWATESAPWEASKTSPLEVIDPRDTRKWLAEALDILHGDRGGFIGEHRLAWWPSGL